MRLHTGPTAIQRTFAFAMPTVAAAWLLTVPAVLTTSSFLALVALLGAFAWIIKATYANGQPQASLAQSLYDAEHPSSRKRSGNR